MKDKVKALNYQNFTFWAPVAIIILSFFAYLSLILFRVIDTTMQEKIHNYLISGEGKTLVKIYITLVVGTLFITFWKQIKIAAKFLRPYILRMYKKVKKLCKKK